MRIITTNLLLSSHKLIILSSLILTLVLIPITVSGECTYKNDEDQTKLNKISDGDEALKLKLAAIALVLVASGIGVSLSILDQRFQFLRPEDVFIMIKGYAAGVILGFVHILYT